MEFSYHNQQDNEITLKTRKILKELPDFCREFFSDITDTTGAKTRLGYAYDLRIFFKFLAEEEGGFGDDFSAYTVKDLEKITATTLNNYMEYLSYYIKTENDNTMEITNKERGKSRKLSAVRMLLKYFYKHEKISSNPGELVNTPKIHEKSIIRLEPDEVARLLDVIESGENLTPAQKRFHKFTSTRDLALVTLLLGTGMRVSECVGIDINHIDFSVNGIIIRRKGGKEQVIYFGEEVDEALQKYLEIREDIEAKPGSEMALFLSLQHTRMSVRAVQNLVKKYSSLVTTMKNITPHKLRSTYGTNLYKETGDIYLVADVLGHSDVNTTRAHYADMADENRRRAARVVKLRK